MLVEIAALLGLTMRSGGTGTAEAPWRAAIASTSGVDLDLAAWDVAAAGDATRRLRIGLRVNAAGGPWSGTAQGELLLADLPVGAPPSVRLIGRHDLSVSVDPLPDAQPSLGLLVDARRVEIGAGWVPGAGLDWGVELHDLVVRGHGIHIQEPLFTLPTLPASWGSWDPAQPNFGLSQPSADDLAAVVRALLSRAASAWGGAVAGILAGLAGLHRRLPGLPADWPLLEPPAEGDVRSLLREPGTALRDWLLRVLRGASKDGTPLAEQLPRWLALLTGGAVDGAAAVRGSGRHDDPWALPLPSTGDDTVELLGWLEPDGPPPAWAALLSERIGSSASWQALLEAARLLAGHVPEVGRALAGRDLEEAASALEGLSAFLAAGDGVVPSASALPADWPQGPPVPAAHLALPRHADTVAAVRAQLDTWAGGAAVDRTVVLLSPALGELSDWDPLLTASGATVQPEARMDLTLPGLDDPVRIDASQLSTSTTHVVARLAGAGDRDSAVASVLRILDRLTAVRPAQPLLLVGHSTAGVVARLAAAARPGVVSGLATVGSPHLGAPLEVLRAVPLADAVRLVGALRPVPPAPATELDEALALLTRALDGVAPPVAPGGPSRPDPFPLDSFAPSGALDTGGAEALALAGHPPLDLHGTVAVALADLADAAAASGRRLPTHLGVGLRTGVRAAPPAEEGVEACATVRVDATRIALAPAAPAPALVLPRVEAALELARPGGWLAGGPDGAAAAAGTASLRRARLGLVLAPIDGELDAAVSVELDDAALGTPVLPRCELADPLAEALLGEAVRALAATSTSAHTRVLGALEALGLVLEGTDGTAGLSGDALAALRVGPAAYLGPRLATALDEDPGRLLGLEPDGADRWERAVAGLPLTLALERSADGWALSATTTGAGLPLGRASEDAWLAAAFRVELPGADVTTDAELRIGAAHLSWGSTPRSLRLEAPPWVDELVLAPRDPDELRDDLAARLPSVLVSSALSGIAEAAAGPDVRVGPVDALARDPARWLSRATALGDGSGRIDGARVHGLLGLLADALGLGHVDGTGGVVLPGNIAIAASGVPAAIELSGSVGGAGVTLDVEAGFAFDAVGTAALTGAADLTIDSLFDGAGATLSFGADPGGVVASLADLGSGAVVTLLPEFGGFGDLLAGAAADSLLALALDELDAELQSTLARDVVTALGLYQPGTGFDGDALVALAHGDLVALEPDPAAAADALVALVATIGSLPGTLEADAGVPAGTGRVTWRGLGGALRLALDWDGVGAPLCHGRGGQPRGWLAWRYGRCDIQRRRRPDRG